MTLPQYGRVELYRYAEVARMQAMHDAKVRDLEQRLRAAVDTIARLTSKNGHAAPIIIDPPEPKRVVKIRPATSKSGRAYEMAIAGISWSQIAPMVGFSDRTAACDHANRYAQRHRLPWPPERAS